MAGIDRQKVRASFHRQAAAYDDHAVVQKRVVAQLLNHIPQLAPAPERILDVGCGTGMLLAALHHRYPEARLFGADLAGAMCHTARGNLEGSGSSFITADAESLPFADGVFPLVTSTSTYQWLTSLHGAFSEARRVLRPGGIFCFALFGERTLFELRHAFQLALAAEGKPDDITHGFFTAGQVEQTLVGAGFDPCLVESRPEIEYHADVPALLKSLKAIGAGNAAPGSGGGLSGRRRMLTMMEIYRRHYAVARGIPATYEVIYGVGRCP